MCLNVFLKFLFWVVLLNSFVREILRVLFWCLISFVLSVGNLVINGNLVDCEMESFFELVLVNFLVKRVNKMLKLVLIIVLIINKSLCEMDLFLSGCVGFDRMLMFDELMFFWVLILCMCVSVWV